MKFLGVIFWCIVIFYVLGLIGRYLISRYINRRIDELSARQGRGATQAQSDRARKREGEVHIERISRVEKQVNRSVGEYVEYEEVEEKITEKE